MRTDWIHEILNNQGTQYASIDIRRSDCKGILEVTANGKSERAGAWFAMGRGYDLEHALEALYVSYQYNTQSNIQRKEREANEALHVAIPSDVQSTNDVPAVSEPETPYVF